MRSIAGQEAQPFGKVVMEIGHALKVCRSARNISLDELAERVSLSQSYLSMIESGKRLPTLPSIEKIAKGLEIPLPIVLFLAAEKDELSGLDEETIRRLSDAALAVVRA